jgi:formylglycine-generating enzyme required for sulfatase activity
MLLIPPGEFLMGSTAEEQARFLEAAKEELGAVDKNLVERIQGESPRHHVRITKSFRLSRHEVTRGQFRRFVEETGYKTEAERDGRGGRGRVDGELTQDPRFVWSADPGFPQTDDHPVVNVSWNDATTFCQWLSKREGIQYGLPTETQWEYACRAGTATIWCCGDSDTALKEFAWYSANSGDKTHPVGQLRPNAWGLCDMHGNVREFCADRFAKDYYAKSPPNDPDGPTEGSLRVVRGGPWIGFARACRSSARARSAPAHAIHHLGFRVASVLPAKPSKQESKSESTSPQDDSGE